ncbi:YtxH domain-containing protein [Mucilaginibacter hurinus]|uniref:YtxH domain-containing protein n=1 Tax=Mucilaginibacter hurinus TaxID=2201324 RepID=A0A367GU03_9SPHI|nr:YtxH domain-containing protein [Mucilaginibacter hurinus]RCH56894.1 YtxH domain-containing protein [Mucilaginibacter hurinus]
MNLLKFIAIGAAVAYGVNYVTKKQSNGRSIFDDMMDKAPDLADNLKKYGEDALSKVSQRVQS